MRRAGPEHAALDQGVRAAVISGTQPSGEDPFAPSGQLDGEPLAYAAALEPGPDADDATALLGYLGRSPAGTT